MQPTPPRHEQPDLEQPPAPEAARELPWERIAAVCGLVAVVALQAKLLTGSWSSWDLRLWDGSWYFEWGRGFSESLRVPALENAPLYCAYYSLFHLLFDDAFTIYFAHRTVMLLAIGVVTYQLFLRLFSPAIAVAACAYLMLLLPSEGMAAYAVRPFVLLPILAASHAALGGSMRALPLTLAAFALAALVRPEYSISLPLLLLLLLWGTLRRKRWRSSQSTALTRRERWILAGTTATVLVTTVALLGVGTGKRSWLAFGQHYGVGMQARNPELTKDPWVHWASYLKEDFGDASSVREALVANPRAFLAHVAGNAGRLPGAADDAVKPLSTLSPGARARADKVPLLLLLLLAALPVLGYLAYRRRRELCDALARYRPLIDVQLAALASVLVASLVIFPLPIHMSALRLAVLLGMAALLHALVGRHLGGRRQLAATGVCAVICLVLMPTPYESPRDRTIVPIVETLDELPLGDEPYALIADSAKSFCSYARSHRHCDPIEILWYGEQPAEVEPFLRERAVRVIVVNTRMMANLSPPWQAYLNRVGRTRDHLGWQVVVRARQALVIWRPQPWAAVPGAGAVR